ncbi:hypothetical protein CSKR_105303 [Clonorchis sinensis]|uniref:Transmembrane protein n=1 Tax=Clonorchis sinensis TaxID=79923 RepID=A0A8T1MPX2_CLOSI|nr:hypothetical protein CSKR_105303 [Clonorchis sinensis]
MRVRHVIFVTLLCALGRVVLGSAALLDSPPYVFASWSWQIEFNYPSNDTSDGSTNITSYTFIPSGTTLSLNDTVYTESGNKTILMDVQTDVSGSQLTECSMVIYIQREKDYFAWTNMSLIFSFDDAEAAQSFPREKQYLNSSTSKKFMTRVSDVYECQSPIPVAFGANVSVVFRNMTFQAFDAVSDPGDNRARETCLRDFKTNVPITALTGASLLVIVVLVLLSPTTSRRHVSGKLRFNTTACDHNEKHNWTSQMEPARLIRIIAVSSDDYNNLCTMLEFRAHMHIYYKTDDNETECHSVPVELQASEPLANFGAKLFAPVTLSNDSWHLTDKERKQRHRAPESHPAVIRIVTTEPKCCTNSIRCFSVPLAGGAVDDGALDGWRLNFTWLRTPESYETGEEGWSSVGAPIGSLSGVYDMVRVTLLYTPQFENKEVLAVSSDAVERFQARVGDFFECASNTDIVLTGENVTKLDNFGGNDPWNFSPELQHWAPGLKVILSMTDVRAQAFSDVNVPEFTGAGVVCVEDHSQDGTMSIVIGLSICALVILVLLGLAMSHLKDRERSFGMLENPEKTSFTRVDRSATVL